MFKGEPGQPKSMGAQTQTNLFQTGQVPIWLWAGNLWFFPPQPPISERHTDLPESLPAHD
jgi:hypothetical protein